MDHDKVTETYVAEILQNKIYYDKFIYLKTSIKLGSHWALRSDKTCEIPQSY